MDADSRPILAIAAALVLLCGLLMACLFDSPYAALYLQPSIPDAHNADVYLAVREAPRSVLAFMAIDLLFILGYVTVFSLLYHQLTTSLAALARLALAAGIAAGLFDMLENSYFITYALQSLYGHPLGPPALPQIYLLASMKWFTAYLCTFVYGLLWKRRSLTDRLLSLSMLAFPLLGAMSIAWPPLSPLRPLPLLLVMLLLLRLSAAKPPGQMG